MPTVPLPDDPSLEQLRKRAKDLRDLARAGAPGAVDLVTEHHPKGDHHPVTLTGAQLVIARHHGFASWAQLKRHIETIGRYRRAPDEVPERPDDVTEQFLTLACLRYGDDDTPARWARAARLLADNPWITRSSPHAAAAAADADAIAALLARDPDLARREGGPYRWEPLLYLVYARHEPQIEERATLATARLLLDHGADPNAGYLWHGLTTPFTALTGTFGNGEAGQPGHPHAVALATLLLEAGADANDGQLLYNRQFGTDDVHLELLLAHGLGRGDGGPWRARLGHAVDSPSTLVRTQLWWAIVHDMRDRVRLLVEHGVDFLAPYSSSHGRPSWARTATGRTPAEVAALNGCPELVDYFVARGARPPSLDGVDALVAAALVGDRLTVDRLRRHVDAARAERPGLIVWAAARGLRDAIPLLVELGFDINALGRSDVPMEESWETALHEAAGRGDLDLARLLLALGANPNINDTRFESTPVGWARHFHQQQMVELLEPSTIAEA